MYQILCCCFVSTLELNEESHLVCDPVELDGEKAEFETLQVKIRLCSKELFKSEIVYGFHKHHLEVLQGRVSRFSTQALYEKYIEAYEANLKNRARQRGGVRADDQGTVLDRSCSNYQTVLNELVIEKQREIQQLLANLEKEKNAHLWTEGAVEKEKQAALEAHDKLFSEQEQYAVRFEDLRDVLRHRHRSSCSCCCFKWCI